MPKSGTEMLGVSIGKAPSLSEAVREVSDKAK